MRFAPRSAVALLVTSTLVCASLPDSHFRFSLRNHMSGLYVTDLLVLNSISGHSLATGSDVAIKFESTKTKFPQLAYEYKLYKILAGGGT